MSRRVRRTAAVACIALVVLAGVLPAVAPTLAGVLFVPLWLVLPAVIVTVIRLEAIDSDEQTVSFLNLLESRAPPRLPVLL